MAGVANDEPGAKAKLGGGETAGLAGGGLIDARNLKEHVPWQHDGNPELWSSLALAHSRFWRAGGHRLVRKDADKHLAFALQEAGDRHTAGLNLVVLDPAAFERLKAVVAKVQLVTAGGVAFAAAALALAKLGSAGQKGHKSCGVVSD